MMKLKKILSLVLVVAMIASMLIVGAAAAETADEVSLYPEASAVMIGLGVIEGDENGYRYADGVTREEAAKIIAYALLGADTADSLKTSVAPFADVAANRWSAGYIAYLKGQGIISGVTDTLFDPTAPVTGIAFAKMMLTAVGYGKAGEFEGADWDINTITYANPLGVFDGTKAADLAAGATREECMLYGFNVLAYVPTVNYNKTFESYYTGTSAINPVEDEDDLKEWTLGYKNYKLTEDRTGGTDIFGRPATSWMANGVVIADTVSTADPDVVTYGALNSAGIYNALGKSICQAVNKDEAYDEFTVYVDGAKATLADDEDAVTINGPIEAGYYTNDIAYAGATTEFYVEFNSNTGKYVITVVISYEHIGEVKRVSKSANTMTVDSKYLFGEADVEIDGDDFDITGYAKGDYVIYTKGQNTAGTTVVASVRAAEPVVGAYISRYTSSGIDYYYTIDSSFVGNSNFGSYGLRGSSEYGNYNFYYDSFGNLLHVEEYDADAVTASYKYLYVAGVEAQDVSYSVLDGKAATVALKVYFADGGYSVLYYAVKFDSDYIFDLDGEGDGTEYSSGYYITIDGYDYVLTSNLTALTNGTELTSVDTWDNDNDPLTDEVACTATLDSNWFSYSLNDDGAVTLKKTKADYAQDSAVLTLATGKTETDIEGIYVNGSTVLTVVDAYGTATTYTGYKNFPDVATTDYYTALVTYAKTDSTTKFAKTITLCTSDQISGNEVYAYVSGLVGSTAAGDTYAAWVDGTVQYITVEAGSSVTAGNVYEWTVTAGESELKDNRSDAIINEGHKAVTDWNTYASEWGETATIEYVDDGFFTTGGVAEADWNEDAIEYLIAFNWVTMTAGSYDADAHAAKSYYYNANTVIYDCVNGGIVTELEEGAAFVARLNGAGEVNGYEAGEYATHIWIVG